MAVRPTYEELERQVRQLREEAAKVRKSGRVRRNSQMRYKLGLEAVNEGLWDWNLRTNTVYFTPRYYTMLGYRPYEMPASYDTWIKLMHPDDRDGVLEVLNRYLTGNLEHYQVEFRLKTREGEWRWIISRGKIIERDEEGLPIRVIGTHTDIHERKQNEARTAHLNGVLQAIRDANHLILREKERKPIIQGICDIFVKTCGYQNVWIILLDGAGVLSDWAESGMGENFRPVIEKAGQGKLLPCARRAREQGMVVFTTHSFPACHHCPLSVRYAGKKSIIMPLKYGQQDYGVLSLTLPDGLVPDEVEQDLMHNVAGDIAFCLYSLDLEAERQRAETELRKYEKMVSTVHDPMILIDSHHMCQSANRAFLAFFRKKYEAVVGRPVSEIWEKTIFEDQLKSNIERCFAGEEFHQQVALTFPDNRQIFLDRGYFPILEEDGTVSGIILSSRDITALKQTEASLIQRTHELGERVKELNCLVGLSMLLEDPDISLDEVFYGAGGLLCAAFQYPDITCVRIRLEQAEFVSENFKETVWQLSAPIIKLGRPVGLIEVCYLQEPPTYDNGPFLSEEQAMLYSVAERLGKVLERKYSEKALQQSESRYRAMFEHMSNGVIICKAVDNGNDFICVDFNKAGEQIHHLCREKVIGKSLLHIFPEIKMSGLFQVLQWVWATGSSEKYPINSYRNGKLEVWRDTFVYKLETSEIVVIYSDETKRKQAEVALRESERQFRDLVENSPVGICIIRDHQMVYENPAQKRLIGFKLSGDLADLAHLHPDDAANVRELYLDFISKKRRMAEADIRICTGSLPTSEMIWVNCRVSWIVYQGEEAILVNMIDITRTREMENMLRIQDKMSSLGRVAAGIAHEIRNPLSGINIYLDTLEQFSGEYEKPDRMRKILGRIQSASAKIESIIKRVMDFSKPGEPKFARIDISQAVEDAIHLTALTLHKSGIELQMRLADELPPCYADKQMIEQVILNLISNAMDAMKNMDRNKIVRIATFHQDGHIHVCVSDSGPGIPSGDAGNIFDPFYSTKQLGTGIGLSLCHRIITDHGGTLDVSPSQWGGAEFTLRLPVRKEVSGKEPERR